MTYGLIVILWQEVDYLDQELNGGRTLGVLRKWGTTTKSTVGVLWSFLEELERIDVVEDEGLIRKLRECTHLLFITFPHTLIHFFLLYFQKLITRNGFAVWNNRSRKTRSTKTWWRMSFRFRFRSVSCPCLLALFVSYCSTYSACLSSCSEILCNTFVTICTRKIENFVTKLMGLSLTSQGLAVCRCTVAASPW